MSRPERSPYIVGPVYDWLCFLGAPVLALLFGIAISGSFLTNDVYEIEGQTATISGLFIGTIIQAHLVAVLFRSHANASIRRQYPLRFFVVPVVVWLAIVVSPWIAVASTVVATFWDVWHSGAQTFGFARIYERNQGTPPELGRRLDFWLMQICYAGPILAGATLMSHFAPFHNFTEIGDAFLGTVPARVDGIAHHLTYAIVGFGIGYVIVYIAIYARMARTRDWRVSWHKVWLLTSTALVSIYSWGFNSWGQAFLIMNLFHGVQYLALVWAMEGKRIAALLRVPGRPRLALAIFLGSTLAYGFGVQILDAGVTTLWALTIVISLMHFWYDAFVWSVRKSQV